MCFSPDGIELDQEDTEKAGAASTLSTNYVTEENQDTSGPVKHVGDTDDISIKYPTIDRMASIFVF